MENFGDYICADSPGDTVQFLEWSPTLCPRALLIGNSGGRVTIWTQPSQVSQAWHFFSAFFGLHCISLWCKDPPIYACTVKLRKHQVEMCL
jgi:hypothetical protein